MEEKLYPDLEQQSSSRFANNNNVNWEEIINKNLKEVNSFNISINNINLLSKFYEEEHKKLKKKYNKFKTLNKILNTIDSVVIIGFTSTSITFSVTGFGIITIPIIPHIGCGITITSKIICEYLKTKEKSYLEKYTLSYNTLQDFRKLHQKALEDNVLDQNEYKRFTDMYVNYQIEKNNQKNTFLV